MEVIWRQRAIDVMLNTFNWYKNQMEDKAATKFRNSILKVTLQLEGNTLMGKVDTELSLANREIRSVVSGKKYRVIYYIDDEKIYIQYIWNCKQNRRSLIPIALTTDIKKK